MNANDDRTFPAQPVLTDPYEMLAATLTDLLQLPIEHTLRQVNDQLDAHPLTRGMRLRFPQLEVEGGEAWHARVLLKLPVNR